MHMFIKLLRRGRRYKMGCRICPPRNPVVCNTFEKKRKRMKERMRWTYMVLRSRQSSCLELNREQWPSHTQLMAVSLNWLHLRRFGVLPQICVSDSFPAVFQLRADCSLLCRLKELESCSQYPPSLESAPILKESRVRWRCIVWCCIVLRCVVLCCVILLCCARLLTFKTFYDHPQGKGSRRF